MGVAAARGALVLGVIVATAACTTSGDDAAVPTPATEAPVDGAEDSPAPSAPPGFETLPPVESAIYPTGPEDVVVQVTAAVEGGVPLPLLTVYGDRRVIAAVGDEWRTGTIEEGALQRFLAETESVGLLDGELDRRDTVDDGGRADVEVTLDVDDETFEHRFDLGAIDESEGFWAFLVRAVTLNVFDLADPFEAEEWITCDADGSCRAVETPITGADRPVLPDETAEQLLG